MGDMVVMDKQWREAVSRAYGRTLWREFCSDVAGEKGSTEDVDSSNEEETR